MVGVKMAFSPLISGRCARLAAEVGRGGSRCPCRLINIVHPTVSGGWRARLCCGSARRGSFAVKVWHLESAPAPRAVPPRPSCLPNEPRVHATKNHPRFWTLPRVRRGGASSSPLQGSWPTDDYLAVLPRRRSRRRWCRCGLNAFLAREPGRPPRLPDQAVIRFPVEEVGWDFRRARPSIG